MKAHKRQDHIMFDTHKYIKQLQSKGFKEAQAASIVELVSQSREHDLSNLATKAQVQSLEKDIEQIKERMATREDIANVRSEIKEAKFDTLKWVIPFLI